MVLVHLLHLEQWGLTPWFSTLAALRISWGAFKK